jgi:hypothetical protein
VREDNSRKEGLSSEELPLHKRCFATIVWQQICGGISKDGVFIGWLEWEFSGGG